MKTRLMAMTLAVMLLGLSTMNVYGANQEVEPITLESVIETTLKNSIDLNNANLQLRQAFQMRQRAADRQDMAPPGLPASTTVLAQQNLNLVEADLAWQQKSKEIELLKDQISYGATEKYFELYKAQLREALQAERHQLEAMGYKIQNVQFEQGVVSRLDQLVNRSRMAESEEQLSIARETRNAKNEELAGLMRVNRSRRYEASEIPEFQPLGRFQLERHVSNLKNSSVYVWLANSQVDVARIRLNIYDYADYFNPRPFETAKIDQVLAENSVMSSEEQLENTVRSSYNALVEIEKQLEVLQINKSIQEQEVVKLNAQYEVGVVTAYQVKMASFALRQLEVQETEMKLQHSLLRQMMMKPWVLGGRV